jgi:hypothetical protein
VVAEVRVRKPFEPGPEGVQPPKSEPRSEPNPEFEEKPVAEAVSFSSEEVHGGSESTQSLPNTPSPSQTPSPNPSSSSASNESPENCACSTTPSTSSSSSSSSGTSNSLDEAEKSGGASSAEDVEPNNTPTTGSSTSSAEEAGGETSAELDRTSNRPETTSEGTEGVGAEDLDSTSGGNTETTTTSEGEDSGEPSTTTSSTSSVAVGESTEEVGETEETEEEAEDEEAEEQAHTHRYNTAEVVDLLAEVDGSTRYWQTEFYRFIEAIAEEKTKVYDPRSPEEYNIKKLMLRPFERKPLSYYRMSRVRDSVVLILDNSGSMDWWASNLRILADLALSREDVEVYVAPNGFIKAKITSRGVEPADHEEVVKRLRGRRIVYVGDYDGANTPVELSWTNDVIWICPESRYRRFRAHDWVRYEESDFRGAFLRVYTLEEMFEALRKLLSYFTPRAWIDLHESDRFYDDVLPG